MQQDFFQAHVVSLYVYVSYWANTSNFSQYTDIEGCINSVLWSQKTDNKPKTTTQMENMCFKISCLKGNYSGSVK